MAVRLADKRGFVLPLVLAMVVILSLVLIAGLSALASLREETKSSLAAVEFERTAASAEARLEYLMLTEPLGLRGIRVGGTRAISGAGNRNADPSGYNDYLTYLVADGRPYRWRALDDDAAPPFRITLQDEAGLVNVGQSDPLQISRLMEGVGLSSDDAGLIASEIIEYNAEPPPHQPIRKMAELFSLPSGRSLISDRTFARIDALAAAHPDSGRMNINTAPREVLKAWFDLTDSQLDQAIKDREDSDTGLLSPSAIGAQVSGNPGNYAFPGGRLRFTFTDPRTGLSYRSTLVLTPNNQERPIWVENIKTQRLPALPDAPSDDLEDFPQIEPGAA